MKRLVTKYKVSKYKRVTSGLLFAFITVIALALCLIEITAHTETKADILLPFAISIVSMLMGLVSMFYNKDEKYKIPSVKRMQQR